MITIESLVAPLLNRPRRPVPANVARVVHNRLLGGWFIVRGRHQTPISGRFESRADAVNHLRRSAA